MPKFRKKPVVIEAVQWTGTDASRAELADFFDEHDEIFVTKGPEVVLSTLEGTMLASIHDWIICGVKGELYPCKPDIFEATYDAVADMQIGHCSACGGTLPIIQSTGRCEGCQDR